MKYRTIELAKIQNELGNHAGPKDEVTAWCPACSEVELHQGWDRCPVCGTIIIWTGSRIWREIYGKPQSYRQRLNSIMPTDAAGKRFIAMSQTHGFRTANEANRWEDGIAALGESRASEIVRSCHQMGSRRRGLIRHVLNAIDLAVSKLPPEEWTEVKWI